MIDLQKLLDTELQKVVEINEDGGMIVDGRLSLAEARKRMYDFWVETAGKEEADDFFENWCTEEAIGTGWLHPTSKEQKEEWEGAEWYVSLRDKSKYEVWVYWG